MIKIDLYALRATLQLRVLDLTALRASIAARDTARAAADAAAQEAFEAAAEAFEDGRDAPFVERPVLSEQAGVDVALNALPAIMCAQLSAAYRAVLFHDSVALQYAFLHPNDLICQGMSEAQLDAALAACAAEGLSISMAPWPSASP
jgi:hypothetical protein